MTYPLYDEHLQIYVQLLPKSWSAETVRVVPFDKLYNHFPLDLALPKHDKKLFKKGIHVRVFQVRMQDLFGFYTFVPNHY